MSKRIEYKDGQLIGDCIYLCDAHPYVKPSGGYERRARFKCRVCGAVFETTIYLVKSGQTKSCGCLRRKSLSEISTKHGLSNHPLYKKWSTIKSRCYNKNVKEYKHYGGRGIKMHETWRNNPEVFIKYCELLPKYNPEDIGRKGGGLSLDRYPNNDGDYEPGNVRWATQHEQVVNSRKRKNNTSGYTGVWWQPNIGKWGSGILVYGKRITIGYYITKKEAVEARNNYIREHNLTGYQTQKYHD